MKIPSVRIFLYLGLLCAPVCFALLTIHAQTTRAAAVAPYGNCPAPTHQGVTVCTPPVIAGGTTIDAPFQLIASGTSGDGQISQMQVWADGKKITQATGTPFDEALTLYPGTHEITVIEVDTTGAYIKSTPFKLIVNGNDDLTCSSPASAGVHVCEPEPNSCHTSAWTSISAAGTGKTGPVSRMELWVSGVKIANLVGNKINTNLFVSDFSNATIVAVDSHGNSVSSPGNRHAVLLTSHGTQAVGHSQFLDLIHWRGHGRVKLFSGFVPGDPGSSQNLPTETI